MAWRMGYGVWGIAHGVWRMGYGAWVRLTAFAQYERAQYERAQYERAQYDRAPCPCPNLSGYCYSS